MKNEIKEIKSQVARLEKGKMKKEKRR